MSSSAFDDVLSGFSRDVNLDKGWLEIKTDSGSKADLDTTLKSLDELYFAGLRRDIAGAIIALADIEMHHPTTLPIENPSKEDLSSEKLTGVFNLWNPFDLGDFSKANQPKPDIQAIRKEVEENVARILAQESLCKRRARSLLQALGLMDIDFVREHRKPAFRSWGQRPQVDVSNEPLLMACQCSECRHCIRSFHYYQCREGCIDNEHVRNMAKMPPPKDESDPRFGIDELERKIALHNVLNKKQPFILCPPCLFTSSHPREHLRAVRGFTKAGDTEALEFARELDNWEDHIDGSSLVSLGAMTLDKIASSGSLFNRSSSRDLFPAGNSHAALMFGPLLIENGATRYPGGALISLRNIPTFTARTSQQLREFIAERYEWQFDRREKVDDKTDQVLHHKLLSVSPDRRIYTTIKPVQERRWMSLRRQVSGGAFTGYCDRYSEGDEEILQYFLASADSWNKIRKLEGTVRANRAALKEMSWKISSLVEQVYGEEIKKILQCFADRLHKRVKLQYNRISNNCQDFCNSMLLNGDKWDIIFRYLYPELPPDKEQDPENVYLRYMMSFAGKMVHPMHETPFVNPLVSSIPLYNSFGHNDADLIDHVSSIRMDLDPKGFGLAMGGNSHDLYLLKDGCFTCPRDPEKLNKLCTLADHLLDGPHDNLSILTFHIHRSRALYTTQSHERYYEMFLPPREHKKWLVNRLEVLSRLLVLNTYLAQISHSFQKVTQLMSPNELENAWKPPISYFGRAWHSNIRHGKEMQKPTWNLEIQDKHNRAAFSSTVAMIHTHPFMQEPEVWKTRLAAIKRRLFDESRSKESFGIFKDVPWENCECQDCVYAFSKFACSRAMSYANSLEVIEKGKWVYKRSHPDFVGTEKLRVCMEVLGAEDLVVVGLREQLERTPEYLDA